MTGRRARGLSRSVPIALVIVLGFATHASAQTLPEPPPTSRPVADLGGPELVWPATTPEAAFPRPILRRGRDMGLISSGIALLSVGMIVGIGIASADLATGNCRELGFSSARVSCGNAPLALIPVAGSLLVGTVRFHGTEIDSVETLFGAIGAVPQILGLVLLLVGMHGFTEDLLSEDDIAVALRLTPWLSGTQLGATLSLSL